MNNISVERSEKAAHEFFSWLAALFSILFCMKLVNRYTSEPRKRALESDKPSDTADPEWE